MNSLCQKMSFLPLFTCCFSLGIWLVKLLHAPFLFLYTLAWVLLILSFAFVQHRQAIWLLYLLAMVLGGLFLSNKYYLAYPHIRNFTFYKSEPVVIQGVVCDFPQTKPNSSSFIVTARQLIWAGKIYSVSGRVLVRVFRKEAVDYADCLSLEGSLFRPYQTKNTQFQYREYLENQGIYSILTVGKKNSINHLGRDKLNPLKIIAYRIRNKSQKILFDNLKATQAGIFSAMILGERSRIPSGIRRLFIQTGTMHVLAISGLHVGIVALILDLLLKIFRIRRNLRYSLIIFLLIFYCLLTGARPSVIRASIMAIVVLSGFLLKREVHISHSLALAALIILAINPGQLFNLGFQLSFASVISIVYLAPVLKKFFDKTETEKPAKNRQKAKNHGLEKIARFSTNAFSVSLAAWLGVLPLLSYYFKIISPITVLANLVVVPYLALVISLGLSLLFVGIFFPVLVPVYAAPANLSIVILVEIIKLFNQIPGAYFYLSGN
ncbi:ComEC/Rec2 family competence protein [Candidatus Omnitrophota bacterium]